MTEYILNHPLPFWGCNEECNRSKFTQREKNCLSHLRQANCAELAQLKWKYPVWKCHHWQILSCRSKGERTFYLQWLSPTPNLRRMSWGTKRKMQFWQSVRVRHQPQTSKKNPLTVRLASIMLPYEMIENYWNHNSTKQS